MARLSQGKVGVWISTAKRVDLRTQEVWGGGNRLGHSLIKGKKSEGTLRVRADLRCASIRIAIIYLTWEIVAEFKLRTINTTIPQLVRRRVSTHNQLLCFRFWVCVCVCAYVYVYKYSVCACLYVVSVYMGMCVRVCLSAWMYKCIYLYVYACVYVYISVCANVCMLISVLCIYMSVCVCQSASRTELLLTAL